jgi:hypothetical protein
MPGEQPNPDQPQSIHTDQAHTELRDFLRDGTRPDLVSPVETTPALSEQTPWYAQESAPADSQLTEPAEVTDLELAQTLDQIGLPVDVTGRAADIAGFSGTDLAAMGALIHRAVAPEANQNPTDFSMSVSSPDGSNKRALMDPEARFPLFEQATGLIHKLAQKMKPGEEQSFLNRAGNIAALTMVLGHPFEDGNGRTARTMAQLIRGGHDASNPESVGDLKLVSTNRPNEGFRINSFVPNSELKLAPEQVLQAAAALDIPFSEGAQYSEVARQNFSTPYETE